MGRRALLGALLLAGCATPFDLPPPGQERWPWPALQRDPSFRERPPGWQPRWEVHTRPELARDLALELAEGWSGEELGLVIAVWCLEADGRVSPRALLGRDSRDLLEAVRQAWPGPLVWVDPYPGSPGRQVDDQLRLAVCVEDGGAWLVLERWSHGARTGRAARPLG